MSYHDGSIALLDLYLIKNFIYPAVLVNTKLNDNMIPNKLYKSDSINMIYFLDIGK